MSTTIPSPRLSFPNWLKAFFLATVVIVACWGAAISFWWMTDREPDTAAVLLALLALPATVFLALWFGPRLIRRPVPASIPAASAVPAQAKEAPSQPALAMLAASIRLPHGASVAELAAAIKNNRARPDLDQELIDDDGFPVMSARSDDATDEALQEEVLGWLAHNGIPELRFSDEQWRALTLGTAVARDLASHAAASLIVPECVLPTLRLVPVLPSAWQAVQRRAIAMWLRATMLESGWPADRVSMPETPADEASEHPSTVIRQLVDEAASHPASFAAILIACASHIGQETIDRWDADALLFKASRAGGQIPGEGAAGLLVTDLQQASALAESQAFALLHAGAQSRRLTAIGDDKRADPTLLQELITLALERTATAISDIAMIVADSDHRPRYMLELMEAAAKTTPQLDGTADVACIGAASGACGPVPFIAALALAGHVALDKQEPLLCIGNADSYRRSVMLVRAEDRFHKKYQTI